MNRILPGQLRLYTSNARQGQDGFSVVWFVLTSSAPIINLDLSTEHQMGTWVVDAASVNGELVYIEYSHYIAEGTLLVDS